MNERIRKLAEQADRWAQKMTRSDDPRYGGRPVSGLFDEKFAELIIQECATYAFSNDEDYYAMLNHFGVKGE